MNKFYMNGKLIHKASDHNTKRCEVEKWVFLPHSDFERLKANPYQEHEAITAARDLMYEDKNAYHCIVLLDEWESATKDNGNEDRETWLRQKHYLAKLKLETENFLYNWDTKNQESDNDTPQNRLNDYINKIVELRKEDWSNFFDNLNCPNYDKDYFKK